MIENMNLFEVSEVNREKVTEEDEVEHKISTNSQRVGSFKVACANYCTYRLTDKHQSKNIG